MAYDGSLKFDTKLDSSGFEKGAKEVAQEAKNLEKQVEATGKRMDSALNPNTQKTEEAVGKTGEAARKATMSMKEYMIALSRFQKTCDKLDTANSVEETEAIINSLKQQADALKGVTSSDPRFDGALIYSKMLEAIQQYEDKLHGAAKAVEEVQEAQKEAVTVDTTPDTEGFEAGTGRMQKAIEYLQNKLHGFGNEIRQAVQASGLFSGYKKEAETAETSTGKFEQRLEEVRQQMDTVKGARGYKEIAVAMDELEFRLHQLKKAGIDAGGNLLPGAKEQVEEVEAQVDVYRRMMDEYVKSDNVVHSTGGRTGMRPSDIYGTQQALEEQAIARFDNTAKGAMDAETPEEFAGVIADLQEQMNVYAQSSYAVEGRTEAMQQVIDQLTEHLQKNAAAWEQERGAQEEQPTARASGFDAMLQKWKEMPTVSGMAVNAFSSAMNQLGFAAGQAGAFVLSALHDPLGAADRALAGLGNGAANAARGIAGLAGGALGMAANGLKIIAGHAAEAAKNLAKMAAQAAVGAFKKLGSMITGIGQSTGKMNGGFKLNLGTILKYGFGIRSLYFLFNKLRRALVDGFTDIMTADSGLKSTVNSMKQSLGNLKLAFASAIAPIAKVVLPALTTMINALADAVNMIGMFIAALTGQKTFKKATAAQEGYASAANSASEALKEEKRQLAGFDELEILSGNDGGGSGGGGGGGGSGSGTTFEDVPIESGIIDWAEKLKEMFVAGDWEGIGGIIADGINRGFAKLDELIKWDNVQGKVTNFVNAITKTFNSLVDKVDWNLIGKTFGDGANTLLHAADLLLTGINWDNLGKKISEGINGLVTTVDWDLLGKTLGDGFAARIQLITSTIGGINWTELGSGMSTGINSLASTVKTALDKIQWTQMGTDFADGVNKLFSGVQWKQLGATVGSSANGVIKTLAGAVTNIQWGDAGKGLADSVNGLFDEIEWDKVGEFLGGSAAGAVEGIVGFIEGIQWEKLGEDVATALANIPWTTIANGVFEAAGAAMGGIAAFLWGVIKEKIAGIKQYFDDSIDNAGGDVASGILNGIANGFKALGTWVKENVLTPFIEGFKKAFGIASPAKNADLLEAAGYVGEGILNGIADTFKNVASWVEEHILGPIKGAINGAGVTIQATYETVGEWASNTWDVVKTGAQTIKNKLQAAFETAGTWAGDAWDTIKAGSQTVVKTVKAVKDRLFDGVATAFATVKNSDAVKTVKGAYYKTFTAVKDAYTKFKNSDAVKTVKGAYYKTFTAVKTAYNAVKNATATKVAEGSQRATFTSLKDAFHGIFSNGATKTVYGERSDGFKTAYDQYTGLEDKTVTVNVHIPDETYRKVTSMEDRINRLEKWESGGVFSGGVWSTLPQFAAGGIIGARAFARSIPRYASGGLHGHGSLFLAGEAGAELVGHVGGRTEVLNRSQMASTMYTAVQNGMFLALNPFANVITNKMAECTNAIVAAAILTASTPVTISPVSLAQGSATLLGGLNDIARATYTAPILSRGTVVPYAASQAADSADIANAITAANGDMTDTLVQAIAAAATMIVTAVNGIDTQTHVDRTALARYTIDEINRRTAMFQTSPLRG